jgi:alkanesulfonate monooxygenase SsuD/methylene tetrahydromethanopterin reductase-like flavin-dependent oxidoreductase (luciferase family)
MNFDIFLSICQTEVDGYLPSEKTMWQNFFDQIKLADQLGFGTAWVAETHLSCQVQKENKNPVIPHFKGEIGLNTDILQLAHVVFSQTKKINVGSAIRNIIANGGPIAHAESVRTFLSLHDLNEKEERKLELGFAAGRFPFSNSAYGFKPQSEAEKNKYFQQATEAFLRLLKGERISSADLSTRYLDEKPLAQYWQFEKIGVIPFDVSLKNLRLTIGSHDPETQILANQFLPTGVFNLSITPPEVIEQTHERMKKHFHPEGGPWKRSYLPRTVMIFLNERSEIAKKQAERAWANYWLAMDGTINKQKVDSAVTNTIAGNAEEVAELISSKYQKDDRLMLWFDFNNHDNESVKTAMATFMEKVIRKI